MRFQKSLTKGKIQKNRDTFLALRSLTIWEWFNDKLLANQE